jgi:hypothetical protein
MKHPILCAASPRLPFIASLAAFAAMLGAAPPAAADFTSPTVGGTGGSVFNLFCGPGAVLVGISGKWGMFLDSLSITCRTVRADGTLGDAFTKGPAGGGGGDHAGTGNCPANEVANTAWFATGEFNSKKYVAQVTIVCGAWNPATRRVAVGAESDPADGTLGTVPFMGSMSRVACPPDGTPVNAFIGKGDLVIDSIALVCRTAELTTSGTTTTTTTTSAPAFTMFPVSAVSLPASTGGDVSIVAFGSSPLSMTMQVPTAYATKFELVTPSALLATKITLQVPPGLPMSLARTVRFKGGVTLPIRLGKTVPVSITVTLTAKDGRGRTTTKSFVVVAK